MQFSIVCAVAQYVERTGWTIIFHSLDKRDRIKVQQSIGQKIFKFGGGTRLKSQEEYSLPAVIAGKEVTIKMLLDLVFRCYY